MKQCNGAAACGKRPEARKGKGSTSGPAGLVAPRDKGRCAPGMGAYLSTAGSTPASAYNFWGNRGGNSTKTGKHLIWWSVGLPARMSRKAEGARKLALGT